METNPRRIDNRPCYPGPRAYRESVNRMGSCAHNSRTNPIVSPPRQSREREVGWFPHRHGDGTNEGKVYRSHGPHQTRSRNVPAVMDPIGSTGLRPVLYHSTSLFMPSPRPAHRLERAHGHPYTRPYHDVQRPSLSTIRPPCAGWHPNFGRWTPRSPDGSHRLRGLSL